ncbi:nucleotidyltransferase family protein [Halobaculum roseum]|nr:nucleotidyltransferase family protein [Halobaculum roseum]QZY04207.1 nucleotidyltransferase family protein [Halobaculum roseum]
MTRKKFQADLSIAGVVLAAGSSQRFEKGNKLLWHLHEEPIVAHATRTLVNSDIDTIVVVTGHDAARVTTAVCDLPVSVAYNREHDAGQSTSVAAGIDAIPEDIDAVVFVLADMPFIDTETVDTLVQFYRTKDVTAVAAGYGGQRGHPVLFDVNHFRRLASVEGDIGGRQVFEEAAHSIIVDVDDPGVIRDIDEMDDINR